MSTSRLVAGIVAAMLLLATSAARAASAADQAAAEALFVDGRKLAEVGDFEHACLKFAESQRLDPGPGTLLNLGDCYEHVGKLASAWGAFKEAEVAARNAGQQNRVAEAARRAEDLSMRLPKLALVVPPTARVPGFEVRRDGERVGEGQFGSALPVDPGAHVIEASAPGRQPWTTTAHIDAPGVVVTVSIPELTDGMASTAPGVPYWSGQRIAGVTIGAAGVVAMGVGSAFTVLMLNKNTASMPYCPMDPTECYAQGVNLRNQALDAAHVATGTFVSGAVVAASGLIVFLTAPKAQASINPIAGPGVAGIALTGAF